MRAHVTANQPAPAVNPGSSSGFHPAFVAAWLFCPLFLPTTVGAVIFGVSRPAR